MNSTDTPLQPETAQKNNLTVPSDLVENPALDLVLQGLRVAEDELRDAAEAEDAESNEISDNRESDDEISAVAEAPDSEPAKEATRRLRAPWNQSGT